MLVGTAIAQDSARTTATVFGFVTDSDSGQPLEAANVALLRDGAAQGGVTDREGRFRVDGLEPGLWLFRVSYIGYRTRLDTLRLAAEDRISFNVALDPDGGLVGELTVESKRTTGAARVTAGQQTVRPADVELVPTPGLSADLVNLLSSLPGVVSLGDRGGQLFLRGGEPSQNLVLLDGVMLYQPFHILGFFSAFPADILGRTDIYAGGYGSRFGERISSVIDVNTRNGHMRRGAGSVTLSPFVSGLRVEGPLIRDRLSFLGSVRRSVVREAASRLVAQSLPFTFGDAFGKFHVVLGPSTRLSIMGIQTFDRGTLNPLESDREVREVAWQNSAAGLRLLVIPRALPLTADLRVSWSRLHTEEGPAEAPDRSSEIENLDVAVDGTFFGKGTSVDWGLSLRTIRIKSTIGGLYQNIEAQDANLEHAATYVEAKYRFGPGILLQPGLRVQFFDVRFAPFLEPRLRAVWQFRDQQLSAAAGIYHQAVLGLSDRRDAASVFTAWTNVPMESDRSDDVRGGRAQLARHLILGYRVTQTSWLEWSVEAYYKRLENLFIAEWTAFPRFTTRLQPASGKTRGFDARVETRTSRFYGSVTYGYSNSTYAAQQASLVLWYGTEKLRFNPPHDRRHQINALGVFRVKGLETSLRWQFGSGLPFSQAVGFDGFALVSDIGNIADVPGSRRVIYEAPFNARLPAYHRLDVSVERRIETKSGAVHLQLSVINVYDRRNLLFLDVFTIERADQLPFIPSFGIKLEI